MGGGLMSLLFFQLINTVDFYIFIFIRNPEELYKVLRGSIWIHAMELSLYMSPAEWIRQAEWIKIANIHFF